MNSLNMAVMVLDSSSLDPQTASSPSVLLQSVNMAVEISFHLVMYRCLSEWRRTAVVVPIGKKWILLTYVDQKSCVLVSEAFRNGTRFWLFGVWSSSGTLTWKPKYWPRG